MTVTATAIPMLTDNYSWLLTETASGKTAIVDPAEAEPAIATIEAAGGKLDFILLTHHHGDHIGGVPDLVERYHPIVVGNAADAHRLPKLDIAVREGDTVDFGGAKARVIDTPGHTIGHIAYYFADGEILFPGDTLFSLGCGRLFEGTAADMFSSMAKFADLPDATLVCAGHEYTASNAKFALSVDGENPALVARAAEIAALRAAGKATLPVSLGTESAPPILFSARRMPKLSESSGVRRIISKMEEKFAAGAAYVRGAFVPVAEASISVLDWGFTRSDAVYDVVHVFRGGFFRLDDHLDRFTNSMRARRLAVPEDRPRIAEVLHQCVALAGLDDAYVAMVASRGRPAVFGSRRPADCENHFFAYAIPWIDVIPKDVQARGAHLWIASVPRVPDESVDPTVKNYQWSDLTTGLLEAHDHGFDTAVLCDAAGMVTEGPGFNIFVVKDGRVLTPDRGSLHGITRKSVLELCAELGIAAEVAPVPRALLEDADEVFAATTAGGVMPVSRIGGRILGNDRPGPISARLKDLYWQKHEAGWHRTPVIRAVGWVKARESGL